MKAAAGRKDSLCSRCVRMLPSGVEDVILGRRSKTSGVSFRASEPPSESGGERGRNRTYNLVIKSHLLCQLSYAPVLLVGGTELKYFPIVPLERTYAQRRTRA